MFALLFRIVAFVLLLVFIALWLAAGAITWTADRILAPSRRRPLPPFAIPRRTSDPRFGSTAAVFAVLVLVFAVAGGSGDETEPTPEPEVTASVSSTDNDSASDDEEERAAEARAARAERRAARLERRLRAERRERLRAAAERRRERREAREQAALLAAEREREREEEAAAQASSCHPDYEGACLDPNASDYDCEGGSGDGPMYTGTIRVVGDDPYDLERDGDGIACDISG